MTGKSFDKLPRRNTQSLIGRLLWPINTISFLVVTTLGILMLLQNQESTESLMNSKAESSSALLQTFGKVYIGNYDIVSLEKLVTVALADTDIAYAVFFDAESRILTETSKVERSDNLIHLEKDIHDDQSRKIGQLKIGIKKDRMNTVRWKAASVGIISVFLAQILLSLAVFATSRGIIRPIHESLDKLSKTAKVLTRTSKDITKFSYALSKGVNEQAEVVQETTASMTEMSSMLAQTAQHSQQSEDVTTSVTRKATNGMSIMNKMVDSMTSVQQANEQLRQIIDIMGEISSKTKVINEIVFKTQLLSFNASIEAARAGQHGRGFAVVAEEVGNLAKMSGDAAQEIEHLLRDSERQVNEIVKNTNEKVNTGQSVTEQALRNFKEIASDITLISTHVNNINSAAREQELGVVQTTQAMNELNKNAEQTNQIAQQSATTAEILENEVKTLHSVFKAIENSILGQNGGRPRNYVPQVIKLPARPTATTLTSDDAESASGKEERLG